MSRAKNQTLSLLEAIACGLLLIGVVGGVFGIVGLSGLYDRVELEFFGIELNDTRGRVIWLLGCGASAFAGLRILRPRSRVLERGARTVAGAPQSDVSGEDS